MVQVLCRLTHCDMMMWHPIQECHRRVDPYLEGYSLVFQAELNGPLDLLNNGVSSLLCFVDSTGSSPAIACELSNSCKWRGFIASQMQSSEVFLDILAACSAI